MHLVRIPIRDGQIPTPDEVGRFLAAVGSTDGQVFVHCGAGVGRTGSDGRPPTWSPWASRPAALSRNLAVGPPSLEQIAFVAGIDAGEASTEHSRALVALSRLLDAPRRLWARLSAY